MWRCGKKYVILETNHKVSLWINSNMSGTKSLYDTWMIYETMLDLERTKFQLERALIGITTV